MKNRKLSVLCCLLLALSLLFCSCGKEKPEAQGTDPANSEASASEVPSVTRAPKRKNEEIIHEIESSRSVLPYIYLVGAPTEVKPGETFSIDIHIAEAENTAAYQLELPYDTEMFELVKTQIGAVEGIQTIENPEVGYYMFYGITATTTDIEDSVVMTLTFAVNDSTPADTYEFLVHVTQFLIGTDDSGDEVGDLVKLKDISGAFNLTVTE